jgi:hypothetical protein
MSLKNKTKEKMNLCGDFLKEYDKLKGTKEWKNATRAEYIYYTPKEATCFIIKNV